MSLSPSHWDIEGCAMDAYFECTGEEAKETPLVMDVTPTDNGFHVKLTHPRDSARIFEARVDLSTFETCEVLQDTLVTGPWDDEFKSFFLRHIEDCYDAMLHEHPSQVTHAYWVTEFRTDVRPCQKVGKWMLFYPKTDLDRMWQLFSGLFTSGKLEGVVGMKCSTGKKNERASEDDEGVIILYCNDSHNEPHILAVGSRLLPHIGAYRGPYLYYKTDEQTGGGTRATGQTKNHLYRIATR